MTQSGRRKPLSGKIKKSLEKKAEDSRFYYGELARVYRKGQGAYLSAGSRNVSMEAWAMGRVNSCSLVILCFLSKVIRPFFITIRDCLPRLYFRI